MVRYDHKIADQGGTFARTSDSARAQALDREGG